MNKHTGPSDMNAEAAGNAAGRRPMSRFLVPVIGFCVLLALSSTLIGVVILRPWAGPDKTWRTHLNLTAQPYTNYTRSVQSFVSPEGSAPIVTWREGGCTSTASGGTQPALIEASSNGPSLCNDQGLVEWSSHGCANCHGLKGEGGVVGSRAGVMLNILQATPDKILNNPRLGRKGMPAQGPSDLTDEQLTLIAGYIERMRIENPIAATPPPPTPTPTVAPTETPVTSATPPPTTVTDASTDDLLAQGKLIFEKTAGLSGQGCAYCHMLDARGQGSKPPNIRGKNRVDIRQALINVLDMNDLKLNDDEITAVAAYLKYLNTQP